MDDFFVLRGLQDKQFRGTACWRAAKNAMAIIKWRMAIIKDEMPIIKGEMPIIKGEMPIISS
ncbi:hypothetical protein BB776_01805 [Planococcus salinarum]|uniref:Uncharacterized protein n=1 Tax=Planococcus salinarum TaxID=622695 RepID=A0ABX3D1R6_9BACL|nr:hypothetical protein BB776_01805 [Planococcus salinarum]